MNVISLIGRATANPELKTTNDGTYFCSFNMAVDDGTKAKPHTSFIPCIAWRHNAEFASQYMRKGERYGIVGVLKQGEYTDKNGQKRRTYDVLVNEISFCDSRQVAKEDYPEEEPITNIVPNDDDLPF